MDCHWSLAARWEECLQSIPSFEGLDDIMLEAVTETVACETVNISSVFLPGSRLSSIDKTDLILLSSDAVRFYVHSTVLQSKNAFSALMVHVEPEQDVPPMIKINESKNTVNIMLHMIYGLSCDRFSHSFQDISLAIDRLPVYGVKPKDILIPSHPMHDYLLYVAPLYPLLTYALASHHRIESLAVACSSHLLAFPLSSISDSMAEHIGALYLKRLFLLHQRRVQELRALLSETFRPHPIGKDCRCSFEDQKGLACAWSLAASYLAWEGKPDILAETLESTLLSLEDKISCKLCCANLRERVQRVVTGWSLAKNTI